MPAPYSQDLRDRVMQACAESKESLAKIAHKFNVSEKTIYNWSVKKAKTGSYKAEHGYQKGHSHAIKDPQILIDFIEEHKLTTIEEMVNKMNCGSKSSIGRTLKRIGYVKKKDKNHTKNKIL